MPSVSTEFCEKFFCRLGNFPTPPLADHSRASVLLLQSPHDDGLEMYAEFLRYHGFAPVAVTNVHDALTVAPAVDVIVTGIRVPGPFDGIDLVRRLRAKEEAKQTPIIVLTACVFPRDRERAARAGCDVFLPKPCLPNDLLREVRRLLAFRAAHEPADTNPVFMPALRYAERIEHV